MKVIAVGPVFASGKSRMVQLEGEKFAVMGDAALKPGDHVLLENQPERQDSETGQVYPAGIRARACEASIE